MTAIPTVTARGLPGAWNRFFFTPRDTRVLDVMRIAYAALMLINLAVLVPDLGLWFSDTGLVSVDASRDIIDPDAVSLFQWLPRSDVTVRIGFALLVVHTILLGLGWLPRLQALGVLVWYASFNHRLLWLWDGEDTLFRLLAFLFVLSPLGYHWSIDRWRRTRRGGPANDGPTPAWGLVLIRIQMTLIYVSAAWEKLNGSEWIDGTAIYYVSRLDDVFGRFPMFDAPFEHLWSIRLMTWTILAVEVALPFGLWIKESRRWAVLVAILLHLSIDYLMVLFLFQWLMIVGLLAFVEPGDLRRWRHRFSRQTPESAQPVPVVRSESQPVP